MLCTVSVHYPPRHGVFRGGLDKRFTCLESRNYKSNAGSQRSKNEWSATGCTGGRGGVVFGETASTRTVQADPLHTN